MGKRYDRRDVLKSVSAACAAYLLPVQEDSAERAFRVAGQEAEIQITTVSAHTFRLSIIPLKHGEPVAIPMDGSLAKHSWGEPAVKLRGAARARTVRSGDLMIRVTDNPLTFTVESPASSALAKVQQIAVDEDTGAVSFDPGDSPLLGLGEGGKQFDRRGSLDAMRNGQGGYKLGTHGSRVPIPWLIGTAGWAMFIHQPFGTFDFSGPQSKFLPVGPDAALPLDIFFVASREPATIMAEYARLTGHAEIPPLWGLGYQQSHRTLASREEILDVAKTFREKKLPCDALIYLGTGFCPSGWNTANGSFAWNARVFPDPKEILEQFHGEDFHAVMHVVILTRQLQGRARDGCTVGRFDEQEAGCYWDAHRKDFAMGIDGWWPDEGDSLNITSRLTRNRMYWEGPQIDRPNQRPYALHRNGYAGMQRYASFLWSGDVYSTWETLKTHIPNAINTALSGIPYWGTDIGGFVPTKEFTAELYLRWFQFGAFCTLFRCHGRAWKLRLPWGWDTGNPGPTEISNYGGAAVPDASQLHNKQVEPICRKYLELRYRMLPYLYSAVRECAVTGMPIMRALWLHYPDDPVAVARDDEYLWGRNILVAPVCEKGATRRRVYLPRGDWYDFWTGERAQGGREINRDVDLEILPLFVRAGAILPLGPVMQHTGEKVEGPLSVTIYPGADGSFLLYEDDGKSFDYRKGEWMGIQMTWNDSRRVFRLNLAPGSRMLAPMRRNIEVKVEQATRRIVFEGHSMEVQL
ncbi:MAG TPA: TIM-barrel domain-containing protein [Candidatus Acidoferrales bacterium]|nr:TIM-barrel domain-containing protein [Candidatus Acidoferrales bacterium]